MGTHKLSILRREGGVRKDFDLPFCRRTFDFFIIYAHHVEPPLARRWNPTSVLARDCGSYIGLARICVVKSGGGCAQWEGWPMLPVPPKGCPLHRGFRRMGIPTASGSKTEIAAPHSRIVRSRKSRDGGAAGSAAYRASARRCLLLHRSCRHPGQGAFQFFRFEPEGAGFAL